MATGMLSNLLQPRLWCRPSALLVLSLSLGCQQSASSRRFWPASISQNKSAVPLQDHTEMAQTIASVSYDEAEPADKKKEKENKLTTGEEFVMNSAALPSTVMLQVTPTDPNPLLLDEVINSVYQSYPMLQVALEQRRIASGELLAAMGNWDLKLKGASENGPTGFYQTYRQSIGFVQPTYYGGEVFGGYRIGRGDFQPWYLERQTNNGGEFKAGVMFPLGANRDIDDRRAELWISQLGLQIVDPDIQAQLIQFVAEASFAYWDWVATGQEFEVVDGVLRLAEDRTDRIRQQVEAELIDPPELTDNLRLVAEREAKLAETARKLQEKAVKLSLFSRDPAGNPVLPLGSRVPDFPEPETISRDQLESDIQTALRERPELKVYALMLRQLEVECALARNQLQPNLDAVIAGSQDVGEPTSDKRDKSEFEAEASVYLDVPLQRRKARGKLASLQGKFAQVAAKRDFMQNKIVAEIQAAHAAMLASEAQIEQAREAVRYAEDLAQRERRNFDEGASDLLKVTLREQYAVESATKVIEAQLHYFLARAAYRAAIAVDRL